MSDEAPTILVIEDNPLNLKLARVMLGAEGYVVHTATEATTALERLPTLRPQLIITDVQLPGMDGLQLVRRLREDRAWDEVPIIALTAYAMKGDEDKARAAGCTAYVAKPLDPDSFLVLVRSLLPRTR